MNTQFRMLLTCALLLMPVYTAQGAIEMFVQIAGIPGELQDPGLGAVIEVQSWHTDVLIPGKVAPGGRNQPAGGRAPSSGSFTFTKVVDSTTPMIYAMCCNGTHIPEAKLICRKAGAAPVDYIVVEMKDLFFARVSTIDPITDKAGEERLVEEVTLNYGNIKWNYVPQGPGGMEPPINFEWDLKTELP